VEAVRVFEADPGLLAGVEPEVARTLRRQVVTEALRLRPGGAVPALSRAGEEGTPLGLLLLDGVLTHRVGVQEKVTVEVVARGDVLWPARPGDQFSSLPMQSSWRICEPTRMALLDRSFFAAGARWPEIMAEIGARTSQRADSLLILRALSTVEFPARLHSLLWHLADRWGRVERAGVVVSIDLSQRTLAELCGARRQSVNAALNDLGERGAVERRAQGGWLLRGAPPAAGGKAP